MAEGSSDTPVRDLTKPRKLWLYVVGLFFVGTYSALFIPALAGQKVDESPAFYTMLWSGLFFYLCYKRMGRRGGSAPWWERCSGSFL